MRNAFSFVFVLAIFATLLAPVSYGSDAAGRITSIVSDSGAVEITIVSNAHGERKAKSGDELLAGDKIVTGPDQTVTIELAEKSELVLAPSSSFTMETYVPGEQQTIIHLFYGMVRALVRRTYKANETFAIKTKDAVMGVRGTEFVAQIDSRSKEVRLHTLKGLVAMAGSMNALRSSQFVLVGAGNMSLMRPGMKMPEAAKSFDPGSFRKELKRVSPQFEKKLGSVRDGVETTLRGTELNDERSKTKKDKHHREGEIADDDDDNIHGSKERKDKETASKRFGRGGDGVVVGVQRVSSDSGILSRKLQMTSVQTDESGKVTAVTTTTTSTAGSTSVTSTGGGLTSSTTQASTAGNTGATDTVSTNTGVLGGGGVTTVGNTQDTSNPIGIVGNPAQNVGNQQTDPSGGTGTIAMQSPTSPIAQPGANTMTSSPASTTTIASPISNTTIRTTTSTAPTTSTSTMNTTRTISSTILKTGTSTQTQIGGQMPVSGHP